jgi:hypothetical protein
MARLRFLVHKYGATATNELCDELADLGLLMCHINKTKFVPNAGDCIINWGCTKWPAPWESDIEMTLPDEHMLNTPDLVRTSTNRLKSLPIMKEAGINVPKHTTDFSTARQWYLDGRTVLARQAIRSFGGHGITVHDPSPKEGEPSPLIPAAFYSLYSPKRHEFRVHVFGGKVIDLQQKKRAKGFDGVDTKVRSYDNGWRFCRNGIVVPDGCVQESLRAVQALGLDFGAVDVGWNEKLQEPMVYEVNTAPGIEGTTVKNYGKAIREWFTNEAQ